MLPSSVRILVCTEPQDMRRSFDRLAEEGYLAGVPVEEGSGAGLLISVTERRTREQIDGFVSAMEKVVR